MRRGQPSPKAGRRAWPSAKARRSRPGAQLRKIAFAALSTEARNPRTADLDQLDARALVERINAEDREVAAAVGRVGPALARAVELLGRALAGEGRLIYVGAGTSGRLGCLDASECPPTFGVRPGKVAALIAGGPRALRRSVEGTEDDPVQGAQDLARLDVDPRDVVCGIASSGVTPYVAGALEEARRRRAATILVTCAARPRIVADVIIAPQVGPEVLAGSTRLKAGTATKLVLNTLTTAGFVLAGKVYGNLMVDVQPWSAKLRDRARRIVEELTGLDRRSAQVLLDRAGGRPKLALVMHHRQVDLAGARALLAAAHGRLREVIGEVDPARRRKPGR